MSIESRLRPRLHLLGLLALLPCGHLAAQAEATVNKLAPILAAEDARDFQEELLAGAVADPDTLVRRTAIRALGHLGDPRGLPYLLGVLTAPDTAGLQAEAAFALGLLRDTLAVPGLVSWLQGSRPLAADAITEGVTALTRIGGAEAARFVDQVLRDPRAVTGDSGGVARAAVVGEAWRLGRNAPVAGLVAAASDQGLAGAAVYSLARLRSPAGVPTLLDALRSPDAAVRANAVRGLDTASVRAAGQDNAAVTRALLPLLDDQDVGVRVNTLRVLGARGDRGVAGRVASAVEDRSTAVQVTAIQALGQLRAPEGVEALQRVLRGRRAWAVRREALVALARIDATAFRAAVLSWGTSGDWRDRAAAAEGWARVAPTQLSRFTDDADARVVAAALQAWADAVPGPDAALLAAARLRLTHPDAAVRAVSAQVVARALSRNDVPLLVEAYHRAARDSFPDAAQMALGGLAGIAASPDSGAVTGFVLGEPAPADPLLKAWAEANWPALAERWGWSRPIETGRTLEDYRDIARRYLVSVDAGRYPRVVMEVQDRGAVPIELFGPDAPLTVANFLRLVDQRYFDGLRFHRVVPNFVVQTGDPRGDGWGGPGWSIRDEINRRRYGSGVVGMALSGPDTGGSQWFITLSPQPHLDGGYTVFGRLRGGDRYVAEITQGDLIRRIHR